MSWILFVQIMILAPWLAVWVTFGGYMIAKATYGDE